MTDATATAPPRSARTIAVDSFLRKTLRVGDPRDPRQIANALLLRYPEEAARALREREGLPYSTLPDFVSIPQSGVAALAELSQAQDDLERDAQALLACSELKDIRPELAGWGRTIRRIADDGLAAARLSLDAIWYDRALAARSQLGSYARLARYVGTLSDGACGIFRRLAQDCDTFAGLIPVAMGEGLAASGITRSTSLVRVAGNELQSRRNAVITALRSLTGSVDTALSQEDWPRGLEAYRRLVRRLDEGGQSDLRALLEETALAQAMDELVDLAAGANVSGLRELSTASAMLIHRFQRLIQYGRSVPVPATQAGAVGSPESPPLAAFTSSLQLFVDAFTGAGGSRLLYIARPPIVIYGLYGAAGPDSGAERLIALTIARGTLAERIDCFAGCECDEKSLRCQILADFLLFVLDRAIDAYAVGTDPNGKGDPEKRAAAFGLLIGNATIMVDPNDNNRPFCDFGAELRQQLEKVARLLLEPFERANQPIKRRFLKPVRSLMRQELKMAFHAEGQTERLVRSLSPSCHNGVFDFVGRGGNDPVSLVRALIRASLFAIGGRIDLADQVDMPAPMASSLASIAGNRSIFTSQN
jgi:hypothetical protein